ncbi:MAG: hypothetical protein K2H11_02125 [Malacoplasma sp.]|nr:hypothetical protein [Malacoplasma sp.]MDE6429183.1 hypothetical protein [Malacoplasma sp.]
MHINKIFKKLFKSFLLFSPVVSIPFISTSCQSTGRQGHCVGSEWEYDGGTFKFESVDYKLIENNLEIKTSIVINPPKYGLSLDGYLYGLYFTTLPNKEKSIEESGFDIAETIYSKQTYIFVHDISVSMLNDLKKEYENSTIENNELNVLFFMSMFGPHIIEFKINILEFIDDSTRN